MAMITDSEVRLQLRMEGVSTPNSAQIARCRRRMVAEQN